MKPADIEKLKREIEIADFALTNAVSERRYAEARMNEVRDRLSKVSEEMDKLATEKATLEQERALLPITIERWRTAEKERGQHLKRLKHSPLMQRVAALERELREVQAQLRSHPQEVVRNSVLSETAPRPQNTVDGRQGLELRSAD